MTDSNWDDNSLAPYDGNDPYMDRALETNERVTNMVNDSAAKELERLQEENAQLKTEVREQKAVMKSSMDEFKEGKRKVEDEYQEATVNSNRLKFRVKNLTEKVKEKEKTIASLKEKLKEKDRLIGTLQFNCEHFEVYLENENKEDLKMVEDEEEQVEQEVQKLQHIRQEAEEAEQQAKRRLAETKKERGKKTQQARKRIELLKRVRNSTTRHNGLSSNGAANVSPGGPNAYVEEDGGSDLHAPLPAFDHGEQAGGNFDLVARPQRRESERSFGIDHQDDDFLHHLDGIEGGGFDFENDDHHSMEHSCITPSPTKGKRGESDTSDDDSEQEKFSDYEDEEMSEEPPAAAKKGSGTNKTTGEKQKTAKKTTIVKTKRDRYNDAMKQRKAMQGKPIEKWNCAALKAECLYKKQKGDAGVPEKKAELFEMFKVRRLRPSPPCSDAEDFDEENKMEEEKEKEEDRQVKRKDDQVKRKDDNGDDTEVEDESAAEEYKAAEDAEESKAEDDTDEYKPEEDEDEL